jgi:hypothetical protein
VKQDVQRASRMQVHRAPAQHPARLKEEIAEHVFALKQTHQKNQRTDTLDQLTPFRA